MKDFVIRQDWDYNYFLKVIFDALGVESIHADFSPSSPNEFCYEFNYLKLPPEFIRMNGAYTEFITKVEWNYGILFSCDPMKIAMSIGENNPYSIELLSDIAIVGDIDYRPMFAVMKVKKYLHSETKLYSESEYPIFKRVERLSSEVFAIIKNLKYHPSQKEFYDTVIPALLEKNKFGTVFPFSDYTFELLVQMLSDMRNFLPTLQEYVPELRLECREDFGRRNIFLEEVENELALIPYDGLNIYFPL